MTATKSQGTLDKEAAIRNDAITMDMIFDSQRHQVRMSAGIDADGRTFIEVVRERLTARGVEV